MTLAAFLGQYLPTWLSYALAGFVHAVLLLHVVAVGALIFIWMERKVSGRIQDRLGPTRVGGRFGWLQTLADGIKLLTKEDLTPEGADRMLFKLAPYISMAAAFAAFLALPFADGWVAQELDVAVFFVLAVLGLEVFGVIMAGYASNSKWSLFGAMREAAQVVSYEVPLGLCVVIPVLVAGTMNLSEIGRMQSGWFTNWLVFNDPFVFVTAILFFTCATASVNRAPFDLAEAESELVAGFHTEYSGIRWSFFFMAEYGSMFTVSALATILFFGGWNGPVPVSSILGLTYDNGPILGYLGNLLGLLNLLGKSATGVTVMMWLRWTLPRLRIDQVMTMCLKYLMPLACVMFIGAVLWQYQFPQGMPWQSSVQERLSNTRVAEYGELARPFAPDAAPADQSPTDQSPTDQSPTDQSPTDQSPTDQSPTDEASPSYVEPTTEARRNQAQPENNETAAAPVAESPASE